MSSDPPPKYPVILNAVQASYGDCFILQFYENTTTQNFWLVDGGPGNYGIAGTNRRTNNALFGTLNSLKDNTGGVIKKLDRVIVTHNDEDHTAGVYAVLTSLMKDSTMYSAATAADTANSKYVTWLNGYLALNPPVVKKTDTNGGGDGGPTAVFPIDKIWFNDLASLHKWDTICNKKAASTLTGWMDKLFLDQGNYSAQYPKMTADKFPTVNSEFSGSDWAAWAETTATVKHVKQFLGPAKSDLIGLLDADSNKLKLTSTKWKQTAAEYKANMALPPGTAFKKPNGSKLWQKIDVIKDGNDKSVKNLSSIMFNLVPTTAPNVSILMTGDGHGLTLDSSISKTNTAATIEFDIFKIMHHGSSNNNLLAQVKGDLTPVTQAITRLFEKYKAKKYVISCDSLGKHPNVDLDTCTGLAVALDGDTTPRSLYLTNGCSYSCFKALKFRNMPDQKDFVPNPIAIYALRNSGVVDYGSIVASTDPADIATVEGNWIRISDYNVYAEYFANILDQCFASLMSIKNLDTVPLQKDRVHGVLPFLESLRNNEVVKAAIAKQKSDKEKTAEALAKREAQEKAESQNKERFKREGRGKRSTLGEPVETPKSKKSKKAGADADVVKLSSPPAIATVNNASLHAAIQNNITATPFVQAITTGSTPSWHDIMVSTLMDVPDLTVDELEAPSAVPTAIPLAQIVADGTTLQWVDLATYIKLIVASDSQVPVGSKRDPDYLASLQFWFLNDQNPDGLETYIVAQLLLTYLLPVDVATEFLAALPLNPNGPQSINQNPFLQPDGSATANLITQTTAALNMSISNFRAQIVVPSPTKYAAGWTIGSAQWYFELAPPASELQTISNSDFFTWTPAFENANWAPGQTHVDLNSLKVKILYPQYTNASTFCYFNGNLSISRVAPATVLPFKGTMCYVRGSAASYDLNFTGPITVLDILKVLSPTADTASKILSLVENSVQIPGIDLTKVIDDTLVLNDGGVILRQHEPLFSSVSLDDLYGTISTNQILTVASDLGIPVPLSVGTLPSLSVTMSNVTGPNSHRISFSVSQAIENIGTVALQVGLGNDARPQFDIWIVTNDTVSVADMLTTLDSSALLPKFEAARVFTDALSHLYVPYAHIAVGPTNHPDDATSFGLRSLSLNIELDDVSIPADNPFFSLTSLALQVVQSGNLNSPDGLSVYGTAVASFWQHDALCTFSLDHSEDVISAYLAESDSDEDFPSTQSTGAFSGNLDLDLTFTSNPPSIGDFINAILYDIAPDLVANIPQELSDVLNGTDFQEISVRLLNDATTNNQWEIVFLYIRVGLYGFDDVLAVLPLTFEQPTFEVTIHYPADEDKRGYEISVGSIIIVNGGTCNLVASYDSPAAGLATDPTIAALSLVPTPEHDGLPVGELIDKFAGTVFSELGVEKSIPSQFSDVLDAIVIDEARLSALKGTSGWTWKLVEATVTSQNGPYTPFESFTINSARLLVSHDTGATGGKALPAQTYVSFDVDLKIGTNDLDASFTYASNPEAWTFALKSSVTLDLVQLIGSAVQGLAVSIPASSTIGPPGIANTVLGAIESILVIDTDSFYISYSAAHDSSPESFTFSNDGKVSLFGLSISNISVAAVKPSSGSWSYSLSLALQSPCYPFNTFAGAIPGVGGLQINNGSFALFSGSAAPPIGGAPIPPNIGSSQIALSGELVFGGCAFMELVSNIVKIDKLDICILPGVFSISIPATSDGLSIMDVFTLKSFSLTLTETSVALAANASLTATWLSSNTINGTLSLIIVDDGGFGISIDIGDIVKPFGMNGLTLTETAFSLVWLAEAEEPQSIGAKAGITFTSAGANTIKGSFDMKMDELNPAANYFKLDIENLTLPNVVEALTHGSLPAPFNSPNLNIGIQELKVDVEPTAGKFAIDADIYLFGIHGTADGYGIITSGIKFSATMDYVNIFDLVKISAYQSTTAGPFLYIDTTAITGNTLTAPTGFKTVDDPALAGIAFALSASLVFLDSELDVYGLIDPNHDDPRLLLNVIDAKHANIAGDVSFSFTKAFSMAINKDSFVLDTSFSLSFGLDISDVKIGSLDLGSYNGTVVKVEDDLSLTVTYSGTNWEQDGIEFKAGVKVSLLGLDIDETIDIDITISKVSDIANAIKNYVEDKIVNWLRDKLLDPIEEDAEKAAAEIVSLYNVASQDLISALHEAGHELDIIGNVLKNVFNLTIQEVVTSLVTFGHDLQSIVNTVSNTFSAFPQEIATALIGAGVTIENAIDHTFGKLGSDISSELSTIGNSITSVAITGVDAVENFFTDTLPSAIEDGLDDAGNWLDGLGKDIEDGIGDICLIL